MFEDNNWEVSSSKLKKDRQYNGQKKMGKKEKQ